MSGFVCGGVFSFRFAFRLTGVSAFCEWELIGLRGEREREREREREGFVLQSSWLFNFGVRVSRESRRWGFHYWGTGVMILF